MRPLEVVTAAEFKRRFPAGDYPKYYAGTTLEEAVSRSAYLTKVGKFTENLPAGYAPTLTWFIVYEPPAPNLPPEYGEECL